MNQCDGCLSGAPVRMGLHRDDRGVGYMVCQKDTYTDKAADLTWTDDHGAFHQCTHEYATELLQRFYNEWPGGWDEVEAERRAASVEGAAWKQIADMWRDNYLYATT